MDTKEIKEQSSEIFKHLYKTAKQGVSPGYDNAIRLKASCIEATGKIMQAKIIAESLEM